MGKIEKKKPSKTEKSCLKPPIIEHKNSLHKVVMNITLRDIFRSSSCTYRQGILNSMLSVFATAILKANLLRLISLLIYYLDYGEGRVDMRFTIRV